MTETVVGEATGTDDIGQLVGIIGSSIGLIILKYAYLLWNIVALIGLVIAWKYLSKPAEPKVKSSKKKKHSERHSSDEDEPEPPARHSRGRSPRHSDRD